MTAAAWDASWLASAAPVQRMLWRGVEAQHRVATLRLVDTLEEQALLEQLLDASKPPLPPATDALHYLLFTPFRYASPVASRFRPADAPGIWYGAQDRHTVAAELAHWRWRHFMDSDGLRAGELVTEHTFFQARFRGLELDLMAVPWNVLRDQWRNPTGYAACHALAQAVHEQAGIAAIRYESARAEARSCHAVLLPQALSLPRLHAQQTWISKTTAQRVLFTHDDERLQFVTPG